MQRIVIVGGGFAGVWAALTAAESRRHAKRDDLEIVVVSRDPWLTIRPRLYEDALDEMRVHLDEVLLPVDVARLQGVVQTIDVAARTLVIDAARELTYDRLILATGSSMPRSTIAGAEHAFSVDSYEDAAALHSHLHALRDAPVTGGAGTDTVVVIGAGFTGIEVATALMARLRGAGARERVRVILIERAANVGPDLGIHARDYVVRALAGLGIQLRTGVGVREVKPDGVLLDDGEWIASRTVVYTAGFRASALAAQLPAMRDPLGRVRVDEHLRVEGVTGVFAAGDVAHVIAERDGAHVAPMSCQIAIPMGEVAGANAIADLLGQSLMAFAHPDYVTCLDLGEAGALFMEGWAREVRLTGYWAKLLKQTINGRLIYPPRAGHAARTKGARAA